MRGLRCPRRAPRPAVLWRRLELVRDAKAGAAEGDNRVIDNLNKRNMSALAQSNEALTLALADQVVRVDRLQATLSAILDRLSGLEHADRVRLAMAAGHGPSVR